jgi:two-component system phosphate regulon response regulator PhoB
LRNIVFRFDDSPSFALALREGDQELALPAGERVGDGEWVLAIFEVGEKRRATAAAARGLHSEGDEIPVLAFERRDWERLVQFAEAGSLSRMARGSAAPPDIPTPPPTRPSAVEDAPVSVEQVISVDIADLEPESAAQSQSQSQSRPTAATAASPVPPSPSRRPSTPRFAHWRASDPFTQGPNARVLLVDDDRDIREVVGAMLDAVGLTVESATSAEEALERVRAQSYDLLVLDWNLPGMTGVELCRLLRRDPRLSTLPVLFLTAHASSRDIVEAFASGADDYVVKPFRAPELGARIFGLLRRSRMSAAPS